jgi:guanylate kinase
MGQTRRGLLLILSGPAGSGKTTLCDQLVAAHANTLGRVVTCTTRVPREGEIDGVDYHFLTPEVFQKTLDAGGFLEHAQVHKRLYGLRAADVARQLSAGHDALINLDVQGAATLRMQVAKNPELAADLVTVFVKVSEPTELRRRLRGRATDAPDEIERRLHAAAVEMSHAANYDHIIESGTRERDYAALAEIYRAARAQRR